jgi:putative endonuclease
MDGAYVYLLQCRDGTLYCGSTRQDMETRLSEHQIGQFKESYTYKRRPVNLLWCEHFTTITDAIACERQLKGWSRAKKLAMVDRNWLEVSRLAQNAERRASGTATSILRQAQDEVAGNANVKKPVMDSGSAGATIDLTLSLSKGRGRMLGGST